MEDAIFEVEPTVMPMDCDADPDNCEAMLIAEDYEETEVYPSDSVIYSKESSINIWLAVAAVIIVAAVIVLGVTLIRKKHHDSTH